MANPLSLLATFHPGLAGIAEACDGLAYDVWRARDAGEDRPRDVLRFGPEAERYALCSGDLLIRTRGESFPVALVPKLDRPALALAPLHIVRPKPRVVDPAYLAWWMASPEAQAALRAGASGSFLPALSPRDLAALHVPVPPLALQREIAAADRLAREEHRLALDLAEARFAAARRALTQAALAADTPIL